MKKLFSLLIAVVVCFTGCGQASIGQLSSNSGVSAVVAENFNEAPNFTDLSDPELLRFIENDVYSDLECKLNEEKYVINGVQAIYISQEYVDELEYNSKSNIYFGYTEEELNEQFQGKRYIFTLGESGETEVQEFEEYRDVLGTVLKNVAIGAGVILLCVTVSVISGGLGAAPICMVFAGAAKTGAAMAVSSGVFSGVAAAAVTGLETHDINQAMEAAALEGSKGFKWGAIIGAITGGTTTAASVLSKPVENAASTILRSPRDSELAALAKYKGREQVTYLAGKEVKFGTLNGTRPDIVRTINGHLEAIEVKNYNLASSSSRSELCRELIREIGARKVNLPEGSTQRIVLDVQGRNFSQELISSVINEIREKLAGIYPNIPIDLI